MVEPHRAPRQGVYPGTGGPNRHVFLVLTLLLLSAGVAIGIALPIWSGASTRGAGAVAPQGIQMRPVAAEAVVVGTRHALILQLTDADGNPMQEAGTRVLVVVTPPPARRADSLPASVDPIEMITNANSQATTTLTVGHTSGLIELVVVAGAETERFVVSALPDRDRARLVEVSGNNQEGTPASIMSSATLVVYTLGQKRFKTKEPRDSRQPVIVLSGRKWPIR